MVAALAAACVLTTAACAAETVILTISLNSISHGEFFLKRNEDGSLLMRSEDVRYIGLKPGAVPVTIMNKESYVSLNDLTGVTATLDEKHLILNLWAGAAWVDLPNVLRDFSPASGAYVPGSDTSAFLNYRVDYGDGNDTNAATWSATGQTGLRRGNLLFLGDGYFQRVQNTQRAVRLMTSLTWDRPETASRWVAGDIHATAGQPSGPIIMGGLSYASAFSMVPGLTTFPMGEFGGVATLPSEADIYVNGVLVRRERLTPGDYRFRNLPVSTGANNVEIVLRDSFGNESRNTTSYYLSERLLKAGLHDYSYNLGFMRRDFGSSSNTYGPLALVARHAFGLSNSLTVGAGAETGNGLVNLIPGVVLSLAPLGVLTLQAGESHDRTFGWGTTSGIGYQFQSTYVNYQCGLRYNSRGYRTLANQQANDTARLDIGTGISVGTPLYGTASLYGSFVDTYAGQLKRSLGASYSRPLTRSVQFSASWNTSWGTISETSFFAGLTFFPANDMTISATLQTTTGTDRETLSLQKNLPVGEGVGYQVTVEREHAQGRTTLRTNPFLQVNGPYGIYTAELRSQFDEQNNQKSYSYLISAAGAVVYAGGHLGLSRPVSDGFAVVQVEGLADVRVMLDNQEVARTNAHGMAYLTGLRSYQENRIAFDDKLIAANYLIKRYSTIVAPGFFGGECVYFPVAKVQGYGGRLVAQDGSPLEFVQVTLHGMGREFAFTTLSAGEFYFENLVEGPPDAGKRSFTCGGPSPYRQAVVPGRYSATISVVGGMKRRFEITITASEDMFVPLGEIRVSDFPDRLKEN